jgi:hypothetical protein
VKSCEEKPQSVKKVVEEVVNGPPCKSKKKMKRKDKVGPSRT